MVAASALGAWITDVDGRRYLDCLAAYSAVNFGHRNPEVTAAAHAQLDTLTLVSRAFHSDRLAPFCAALAQLCGKDMVLPMNSGAEAVEKEALAILEASFRSTFMHSAHFAKFCRGVLSDREYGLPPTLNCQDGHV